MGKIKLRHKSWWWGRYVVRVAGRWYAADGTIFPEDQYDKSANDFEPYIEEIHGLEAGKPHMDDWELKRFFKETQDDRL